MAHSTTPHTQSQQNQNPDRTDLEADQLEQAAGRGSDAELYRNHEGAQTGTNRGPTMVPRVAGRPNVEPETEAHEGSSATRTPKKAAQGVTSHTSEEESARQERVVNERPDAKAGVNRSR